MPSNTFLVTVIFLSSFISFFFYLAIVSMASGISYTNINNETVSVGFLATRLNKTNSQTSCSSYYTNDDCVSYCKITQGTVISGMVFMLLATWLFVVSWQFLSAISTKLFHRSIFNLTSSFLAFLSSLCGVIAFSQQYLNYVRESPEKKECSYQSEFYLESKMEAGMYFLIVAFLFSLLQGIAIVYYTYYDFYGRPASPEISYNNEIQSSSLLALQDMD